MITFLNIREIRDGKKEERQIERKIDRKKESQKERNARKKGRKKECKKESDGRTDGRINGRTNGQMDKQTGRQTALPDNRQTKPLNSSRFLEISRTNYREQISCLEIRELIKKLSKDWHTMSITWLADWNAQQVIAIPIIF